MTYHIFREESISPVSKVINIRTVIDSSSPHLVSFGCRTVVAQPGNGGTFGMLYQYEDSTGGIHNVDVNDIQFNTTDGALGGVWYHDQFLSADNYFADYSGNYAENPLGICKLNLTLNGSAGTAKITYEMIFQTFDGNPSVVFHPAS